MPKGGSGVLPGSESSGMMGATDSRTKALSVGASGGRIGTMDSKREAIEQLIEREGISSEAAAISSFLVLHSENAVRMDPCLTIAGIAVECGFDEQNAVDAVEELDRIGLVEVRKQVGRRGEWDFGPTADLFVRTDEFFMDWDPANDAERIATDLVRGEWSGRDMADYVEARGWTPRRLNPALQYLIANGLVESSREMNTHPFRTRQIDETSATRGWLRNREREYEREERSLAEQQGLSEEAARVARFIVLRSDYGCDNDPMLSIGTIERVLGFQQKEIVDAIVELAERGMLYDLKDVSAPLGYSEVAPKMTLFSVLDSYFMSWQPEDDALTIAKDLASGHWNGIGFREYAARLGWRLRRLNPALSVLIENELVDTSDVVHEHFEVAASVLCTPRTRDWIRQSTSARTQAIPAGEAAASAPSTETVKKLQVFLCHASEDKSDARNIYQRLCTDGYAPWLDEEDLIPGQDWEREIPLAVNANHVVVVLLSRNSITKEGYFQKEIKLALDAADEKPEGSIFIIPARLEECEVPGRLQRLQRVDLYRRPGYERLKRALNIRAQQLGVGRL